MEKVGLMVCSCVALAVLACSERSLALDAAVDQRSATDAAPLDSQRAPETIDAGQALSPVISPSSGRYSIGQIVTITAAEAGASVYYTLDGSEPSSASPLYVAPIAMTSEGTFAVKGLAVKAGLQPSNVSVATYTIELPPRPRVATPRLSPAGGIYGRNQLVTIGVGTSRATIRYTTDGSLPSPYSAVYGGAIAVKGPGTTLTISAYATREGMDPSEVASETYAIRACEAGSHDGGDGGCVLVGTCAAGYHDGGAGTCVLEGCATGYLLSEGKCSLIFRSISANSEHTCGVKQHDGTVVCWGDNHYGQLDAPPGAFTSVSAGVTHSCGVKSDGAVVCWGDNQFGQLDAPPETFVAVSAGGLFSCGLKSDSSITCWGRNDYGELAAPAGTFVAVSAGVFHGCGLKNDRTLGCWGFEGAGGAVPPGTFAAVAAGVYDTCGVRSDGTLSCWDIGYAYGYPPETTPLAGTFIAIGMGYHHSCALKTDGSLACWGENNWGESRPPAGSFSAVTSGYSYSCALKTDGTAVCWGNNAYGQCTPP